jgi:hypothetical protein
MVKPNIIVTGKNFTDIIRNKMNETMNRTISRTTQLIDKQINPELEAKGFKTTPANVVRTTGEKEQVNITSVATGPKATTEGASIVHKHFVAFMPGGK